MNKLTDNPRNVTKPLNICSDFHLGRHFFGLVGGFIVGLFVTLPHEIVQIIRILSKMKTMKPWRIAFVMTAAMLSLASCSSDDKDMVNDTYKTLSGIALTDWPLTDCSTSTRPVRDLVAYKLLDIPYKWEVDWMSGTTYIIQPDFSETESSFSYSDYLAKNLCSGTHGAYTNLIEGKCDIIIASRDISRNEKAAAKSLGVELETAPLAIDALVFIVNPKNPVKNLTTDQVRKIYTGEITNWKEVGGVDHAITPYIRDADSGSQEKMETLVMNGLNMIDGTLYARNHWFSNGISLLAT